MVAGILDKKVEELLVELCNYGSSSQLLLSKIEKSNSFKSWALDSQPSRSSPQERRFVRSGTVHDQPSVATLPSR